MTTPPLEAYPENLQAIKDTITVNWEIVTPDIAREWLGFNTKNRGKKPGAINTFSRDMVNGLWRVNGEAIKFDGTGQLLLDGQNRLLGIISADISVVALVIRGLHPDSQKTMDTGTKRSAGDSLRIDGEKYAVDIAAAAQLVYGGIEKSPPRLSNLEIFQVVEIEPMIVEIVTSLYPKAKLKNRLTPRLGVYLYWLLYKISPDDTEAFFQKLADQTMLEKGSPILALNDRLRNIEGHSWKAIQEQAASVIRAWNAYRKHESLSNIYITRDKSGRPVIPEPK